MASPPPKKKEIDNAAKCCLEEALTKHKKLFLHVEPCDDGRTMYVWSGHTYDNSNVSLARVDLGLGSVAWTIQDVAGGLPSRNPYHEYQTTCDAEDDNALVFISQPSTKDPRLIRLTSKV